MVYAPAHAGDGRRRLGGDISCDGIWYHEYGAPGHAPGGIMVYDDDGGKSYKTVYACGMKCNHGAQPSKNFKGLLQTLG